MKKEKDFVTENIGKHIKSHRKAKGLTQAKLAEFSHISTNHFGLVERGKSAPSLECIFKIAVGLNIDPITLITDIKPDIYPAIIEEVKKHRLE